MNSVEDMIKDIKNIYGLSSPRVFKALKIVPRERFISKKYRHLAYEDTAIRIGKGQTISQPFTVCFMTHLLNLKGGEKVLEIGTGTGYQSSVLSFLAKEVYTIERIKSLAKKAKENFKKLDLKNIKLKIGQGEDGWKKYSPFDAILIAANTPKIPQKLFDQLKEGGVIVAPVGEGNEGKMTKFVKKDKKITKNEYGRYIFVPLITKI
ncbi:protein-L-isoaspartate(D-aspartate) O-methyltransferase [Patescibacteria group bacterium]